MTFRPMLAAKLELEMLPNLRYPFFTSYKIDGVRSITKGGILTRSLKPVPNLFIQSVLGEVARKLPNVLLDGELEVPGKTCSQTVSAVMSRDGTPVFNYLVFDAVIDNNFRMPFKDRLIHAHNYARKANYILEMMGLQAPCKIEALEQKIISDYAELMEFEEEAVAKGYEGLCMRSPFGPYKFNRSTVKEGYLLKYKRFVEVNADIIGFTQLYTNLNEAVVNELGFMERSHSQENLEPVDMLGAFTVKDEDGLEYNVGSGFSEELRREVWKDPTSYLGRTIVVKYMRYGMKDLPRHPTFKGFRSELDM